MTKENLTKEDVKKAKRELKKARPFYKKKRFIVPACFIALMAFSMIGDDTDSTNSTAQNTKVDVVETSKAQNENTSSSSNTTTSNTSVPTEYKNALKKAEVYSKSMNMSKRGIYDQLTSQYGEGFTAEAAQYAIDNIKADWNANALAKAKTYYTTMSMSKQGVYDQLVSEYGEKFAPEEAQYAINNLE